MGNFPDIPNEAAPNTPYYTPLQKHPAGTAIDTENPPKLFKSLKIRGLTLPNRITLSPLCQYSAENGHVTDWHLTHLGGIIQRGPGLAFVEATAISPEGRITPEDVGLWLDSQGDALKRVVDFAHSQGKKIGIQLAHAGRKGSTIAPWLKGGNLATKNVNGWPDNVYGPSGIPYSDIYPTPKPMTKDDIAKYKNDFVAATKRALKVGFDVIEIHAAHGYLLHNFLSPVSNKRTDEYGGSFENRIRLLLEVVELVRKTIPDSMPLFVRISGTDFLESEKYDSWKPTDTAKIASILAEHGVDLLDVSGGGNSPAKIEVGPSYQAPAALEAKKAVGDKMLVSAVGSITSGKQANGLLEQGLDMVMVGKAFLQNPGLVFAWADELGLYAQMPNQIHWAFKGRH